MYERLNRQWSYKSGICNDELFHDHEGEAPDSAGGSTSEAKSKGRSRCSEMMSGRLKVGTQGGQGCSFKVMRDFVHNNQTPHPPPSNLMQTPCLSFNFKTSAPMATNIPPSVERNIVIIGNSSFAE